MPTTGEAITTVDLLRHGACQGGFIYRGRTDVELSGEGWRQMEQAIGATGGWQKVVTSPLLRCRLFAEHCAQRLRLPLLVIDELQEIDFGAWEGQLVQDVRQANPEMLAKYYEDPEAVTPPGGERTVDAQQRILRGWQTLLRDCTGEHLLVVCHGGVIRLLLSHLLAMPLRASSRLHVPFASLSRVHVYHRDDSEFPVLTAFNWRDTQS
jgi:alpha-ribazole phosphatase